MSETESSSLPPGLSSGLISLSVFGILPTVCLAGLIFPMFTRILNQAEEARTVSACYKLKNAVASYFTEYQKYPAAGEASKDITVDSTGVLWAALTGLPEKSNEDELGGPRSILFISARNAKPMKGKPGRKGIVSGTKNAGLYDAWGNPYRLAIDADSDSTLADPKGNGSLPLSVLVWSAGPDGEYDTWEDNIKTW